MGLPRLPVNTPPDPNEANKTHSNLGSSETGTSIQSDTVSTCTAINFDLSGVRLEALSSILGSYTALNGESTLGDGFLGETELRECSTSCDLDLSSNDIDASNFLYGYGESND